LLLSVTLLAGACDHRDQVKQTPAQAPATSAASRTMPTTTALDKSCLQDVRSARPFWCGGDPDPSASGWGGEPVGAGGVRGGGRPDGDVAPPGPVLFVAAANDEPFVGAARAMYRRARAADKRLLIVRRGHGSTMLAYWDEGPRVLAAVRRFIADQTQH
jgi:hypothetical protein